MIISQLKVNGEPIPFGNNGIGKNLLKKVRSVVLQPFRRNSLSYDSPNKIDDHWMVIICNLVVFVDHFGKWG